MRCANARCSSPHLCSPSAAVMRGPGWLSLLSLPGRDAQTATVYETRAGEVETIALSARSQFGIGVGTHVVAYHVRHLWTVDLHDGEAEFSQRDAIESLLVHSAGAVMVATDASFNIYNEPDAVIVTVIDGVVAVDVYPAYWRGGEASEVVKSVVLRGGQCITYHVFTRELDVGVGDVARAAWGEGVSNICKSLCAGLSMM
jgi:ferric-dicitrate binding protein FerR (iron transport regulator)